MKKTGFSLIEVIVYMTLFSMITTSALVATFSLLDTLRQNKTFEAAYSEGLFISKKIDWLAKNAQTIDVSSGTKIQVTRTDSKNIETINFYASGSRFWVQRDGFKPLPVSGQQFSIKEFSISTTTDLDLIQVHYTVDDIPFYNFIPSYW